MAWVEKHSGGYRVRYWSNGRGSEKLSDGTAYKTKSEAKAAAKRIDSVEATKLPVRAYQVLPMAEVIERWKTNRIALKKTSPQWTERTAGLLNKLCEKEGWVSLSDISPQAVSHWKERGGQERLGAYLRACLNWARKAPMGQPVDVATLEILAPSRSSRQDEGELVPDALVEEWLEKAKQIGPSSFALLHCLSTYGWRPITAAKVKVGDVNLDKATIVLRGLKGDGGDLRHPLKADTVEALRPLCGRPKAAPLFLDPRSGAAWATDGAGAIHQWFRIWVATRASGWGVYDLKRYAISRMLERGIAPQTVQLFSGHRTLSQVLRYAKTNENKARAALEALG